MFSNLFKKSKTTALDAKISAFSMHYGNNYKDEAHKAYKEAVEMYEALVESGDLVGKDVEKYRQLLDSCSDKLKNYTHYNHIGW